MVFGGGFTCKAGKMKRHVRGKKRSSLKTNHRDGLSSGWSFAAGSTLWKERKKCTRLVVFVKKINPSELWSDLSCRKLSLCIIHIFRLLAEEKKIQLV